MNNLILGILIGIALTVTAKTLLWWVGWVNAPLPPQGRYWRAVLEEAMWREPRYRRLYEDRIASGQDTPPPPPPPKRHGIAPPRPFPTSPPADPAYVSLLAPSDIRPHKGLIYSWRDPVVALEYEGDDVRVIGAPPLPGSVKDESGQELTMDIYYIDTGTGEYRYSMRDEAGSFIIDHIAGRVVNARAFAKGITVTPKDNPCTSKNEPSSNSPA